MPAVNDKADIYDGMKSFGPEDTVSYAEKSFTFLKQYLSRIVDESRLDMIGSTAFDSLEVNERFDRAMMQVVYDFSVSLLADKLVDDTYTAYHHWQEPKTGWQMLKLEHGPKWFLRRFPVQYEKKSAPVTVKFERYATYPKANESIHNTPILVRFGGLEALKDVAYQVKGEEYDRE